MRSRIAATLSVAGALALPGTALAMPIDNGPPPGPPRPIETVTIVRDADDTLPIALASAALLLAMGTAGYSAVRLAPLRRAES
jgi:hypothetical protein